MLNLFLIFSCVTKLSILTSDLDSAFVAIICASQTDIVIKICSRADTLVAAIIAVVSAVADLCFIDALAIVTNIHAVAVYASLPQFVIIELLVGLKCASHADIAAA